MEKKMSLARKIDHMISEEDYLEGEIVSDIKYEYIDGEVYAMAGASEKHNLISGNFFYEISSKLRKNNSSCKTFTSDMKVKATSSNNNYFYPDTMVVCNDNSHDTDYTKNSPLIIVEVLSKSTRKIDTTIKMINYLNIPSLEEYVIIEQSICEVQVFRKSDNWKSTFYFLGDKISFESIDVTISVEDIYYQVDNEELIDFIDQKQNKKKAKKKKSKK